METTVKVSLKSGTAEKIGLVTARKLFESCGNHSEIHLSEKEVAVLVESVIDLVFEGMSVWESK